MSDLESVKSLDNSSRQPLTGWELGWKLFVRTGLNAPEYYTDSAFPACPACGSPNVMLEALGHAYQCLESDCKNKGEREVEGRDRDRQHVATVRAVVLWLAFAVLVTILAVVLFPGASFV